MSCNCEWVMNVTARIDARFYGHTDKHSTNPSPGNFNNLATLSNVQKISLFERKYFIWAVSTQTIILIAQLTQFLPWGKDGYPCFVKSLLVIPFMGLQTRKIRKPYSSWQIFPFSLMNYVSPSFIMPQRHMSNSSSSLIHLNATL